MIKWLVAILVGVGAIILISNHKPACRTGRFSNSQIEQQAIKKELPYEKYSFENLAKRGGVASKIGYSESKFYYYSEGRRISGEVNNVGGEVRGIVIMARGYIDKEIYKTGMGTHNAAKYFAEQGYVTYAPDFSGYGESDPEDPNALGARLVKPVEILDLIASVPTGKSIFLWGHSNGGQIMLSVAEILGKRGDIRIKGATLWAPVSKPFPYNILYYTDEASDSGKWLRGRVANFEKDYDVFNYSIDRCLDWINIPVQIHQGTADEAVPKKWSDDLAKTLKEKGKEITYWIYPGADHNMRPGWDQVVRRDVEWFNQLVKEAP
ncbi:MAG: alpha/beta fold hydrolase [bacterium]